MRRLVLLLAAIASLCAQAAIAQTNQVNSGPPSIGEGRPHAGGGHPPGPPPEAFSVCSGKIQGAACSMTSPRGESMSGTCAGAPPDHPGGQGVSSGAGQLVCRPDRMPPGRPGEKR